MKKKKWMMMAVMVLALTMMFGTTVYVILSILLYTFSARNL